MTRRRSSAMGRAAMMAMALSDSMFVHETGHRSRCKGRKRRETSTQLQGDTCKLS
ncbi:hypothetical protein P692DRAFT_20826863, partial [Suillus brevipes Sb2]